MTCTFKAKSKGFFSNCVQLVRKRVHNQFITKYDIICKDGDTHTVCSILSKGVKRKKERERERERGKRKRNTN